MQPLHGTKTPPVTLTARTTCPQCGGSGSIPAESDYRTAPSPPNAIQPNAAPFWQRVGVLALLVGAPTYAWFLSGLLPVHRLPGLGLWAVLALCSFMLTAEHWEDSKRPWRTSTIVLVMLYWPVSWSYFAPCLSGFLPS